MASTTKTSGGGARIMSAANLAARVDAVERLTKLFQLERMVYLGATSISFLMLLVTTGALLVKQQAGAVELTGLFGSTGLIGLTAGRMLYMWDKAFRLLGVSDAKEKS
jgi:hypothetical protein